MAIELSKGERVTLQRGLKNITLGLGWDPNEGTGHDFDLDASAFMLNTNGKIPKDEYFIYYNNMFSPDGSVEGAEDDLTGDNSRQVVSFGTEAGLFQEIGISTVVCGPGSIDQAHKIDEFIVLNELKKCLNLLDGIKVESVSN